MVQRNGKRNLSSEIPAAFYMEPMLRRKMKPQTLIYIKKSDAVSRRGTVAQQIKSQSFQLLLPHSGSVIAYFKANSVGAAFDTENNHSRMIYIFKGMGK